jgi:hypothetical protein
MRVLSLEEMELVSGGGHKVKARKGAHKGGGAHAASSSKSCTIGGSSNRGCTAGGSSSSNGTPCPPPITTIV